jgi:hypothetical protein
VKALIVCFLLIALLLIACDRDDEPTPDVAATVQVAAEATAQMAVQATVPVAAEATVQAAVEATLAAQPTSTPEPPVLNVANTDSERPYRSYPAPTGYPGFRLYYQKRCYPGCHTYGDSDQVHP